MKAIYNYSRLKIEHRSILIDRYNKFYKDSFKHEKQGRLFPLTCNRLRVRFVNDVYRLENLKVDTIIHFDHHYPYCIITK